MKKRLAFTMAEILLSLTIIGVVAAITLPALTGNINERTWNTQRKALYARMSQAVALMPALNGYGTLTEDSSGSVTEDTAAETFVTDGLSKVLKINNICNSDNLEDCGLPSKFTTLDAASTISLDNIKTLTGYNSRFNWEGVSGHFVPYSQIDTKAAAFETANGESILVYYNPYCQTKTETNESHKSQPLMCANFVYDLNGNKGPNTVGKDIGFITALYASDPVVVAPNMTVSSRNASANIQTRAEAVAYCHSLANELRLPNIDEASAIFYNEFILGIAPNNAFWTSSVANGKSWRQSTATGNRSSFDLTATTSDNTMLFCIGR